MWPLNDAFMMPIPGRLHASFSRCFDFQKALVGMPRVLELLLKLSEGSGPCSLNGGIGLQEQQRTLLLQFREQIQGHRIIGLEASGELIDQARLCTDQGILITCQLLEFCHLVTIRGQPMQIGEIGTPSLGQQVGIDQIRLGSTGRSATIHRARVFTG